MFKPISTAPTWNRADGREFIASPDTAPDDPTIWFATRATAADPWEMLFGLSYDGFYREKYGSAEAYLREYALPLINKEIMEKYPLGGAGSSAPPGSFLDELLTFFRTRLAFDASGVFVIRA